MNQCECEYESIHIQEYESDQIHIFFMNLIRIHIHEYESAQLCHCNTSTLRKGTYPE